MAVMRCYSLAPNKITHILQDSFINSSLYNNKQFPNKNNRDERINCWRETKSKLEHNIDCKHEDEITYIINESTIAGPLCFAIGNGKLETLMKIFTNYLAEKEKEQEKIDQKTWDLSDETKTFKEHMKALQNPDLIFKNKLSNENSKLLLYSMITSPIKTKVNQHEWVSAIQLIAKNLQSFSTIIDKYTTINKEQFAIYLKDLLQQSKDVNFLDKLKKMKNYENPIEIGIIL